MLRMAHGLGAAFWTQVKIGWVPTHLCQMLCDVKLMWVACASCVAKMEDNLLSINVFHLVLNFLCVLLKRLYTFSVLKTIIFNQTSFTTHPDMPFSNN